MRAPKKAHKTDIPINCLCLCPFGSLNHVAPHEPYGLGFTHRLHSIVVPLCDYRIGKYEPQKGTTMELIYNYIPPSIIYLRVQVPNNHILS